METEHTILYDKEHNFYKLHKVTILYLEKCYLPDNKEETIDIRSIYLLHSNNYIYIDAFSLIDNKKVATQYKIPYDKILYMNRKIKLKYLIYLSKNNI